MSWLEKSPSPADPSAPLAAQSATPQSIFLFPHRLPSAADTSAWVSGLSGSRTLRGAGGGPQLSKTKHGAGGAERIWELVAHWRC